MKFRTVNEINMVQSIDEDYAGKSAYVRDEINEEHYVQQVSSRKLLRDSDSNEQLDNSNKSSKRSSQKRDGINESVASRLSEHSIKLNKQEPLKNVALHLVIPEI